LTADSREVYGGQPGAERQTAGKVVSYGWVVVFLLQKNNTHNKKVMQLFGYYKIIMYLCAVITKQGYYT
jgi:hypothetical protein